MAALPPTSSPSRRAASRTSSRASARCCSPAAASASTIAILRRAAAASAAKAAMVVSATSSKAPGVRASRVSTPTSCPSTCRLQPMQAWTSQSRSRSAASQPSKGSASPASAAKRTGCAAARIAASRGWVSGSNCWPMISGASPCTATGTSRWSTRRSSATASQGITSQMVSTSCCNCCSPAMALAMPVAILSQAASRARAEGTMAVPLAAGWLMVRGCRRRCSCCWLWPRPAPDSYNR